VENENTESWYWFLQHLKNRVVAARPNVCLISDRNAGLLAAIIRLQEGSASEPPIWTDVRHRWCIRHMAANFYDHFKNKDLMDLFKLLCAQNQQRKFNDMWQRLDDLTAKFVQQRGPTVASTSTSSSAGPSQANVRTPFS